MSKIFIKNILFPDGKSSNLLIDGKIISKISNTDFSLKEGSDISDIDVIIDGTGKAVIPGLINMHTHSTMTLMRGIDEDDKLHNWLKSIWKIENRLDPELVYWGTKLACLEMIKTGTTCYFDEYRMVSASAPAAIDMNLRSFNAYEFLDFYNKAKINFYKEECIKNYEESLKWNPIANFSVSVHSPYTVSPELIIWATEFAREKNLLLNIHLAETQREVLDSMNAHGLSPVAYLDKLGVLGPNLIAAHSLWLSEKDIELLAKNKVTVVHNINSNLKLASGYKFLYKELKEAGVRVCIGTDGCASSNNLDLLEALKTSALVQKAWRCDPTIMPINELMNIATTNAAEALNINAGKIEEGMLADLIIIDINNYAFTPNINLLANLIYSANSSCVDTLICDGNILMKNRVVEGEKEILEHVNSIYKRLC